MIKFLLDHRAIANSGDSIASYEDAMYDRVILKTKTGTVYIFGSNSPHSGKYIALQDYTGLKLLNTSDLPTELTTILDFLKRNKVGNQQLFKCLNIISEAYQYNTHLNFRPQPDK